MLNQLLKIIRNNLRANLLLIGGLFIIAISLWDIMDYFYTQTVNLRKPLGFDWEHVYHLKVGVIPRESSEWDVTPRGKEEITDDFNLFIARLKEHQAVSAACHTQVHAHYVMKNSYGYAFIDTIGIGCYWRGVSPDYFTVFKVKGVDGTSPEEMTERAKEPGVAILTADLAEKLLNAGNDEKKSHHVATEILGKRVTADKSGKYAYLVNGVCEPQKYNETTIYYPARYQIMQYGKNNNYVDYSSISDVDVYIRVKPNADNADFIRTFRQEMRGRLRVGNLYLEDIKSMGSVRDMALSDYHGGLKSKIVIFFFMLLNAFLAIIGTFWFRTRERTEELSIRLIFGATPQTLMKMLIGEGLLLISFAFIPVVVLVYCMGNAEMIGVYLAEWNMMRFFVGVGLTFLVLLSVAVLSVWFPARKAMQIDSVEALHGE